MTTPFGIKLRESRAQSGASQTGLARKLGIPLRTWQDWESGRRNPPAWVARMVLGRIGKGKVIK